MERLLCDHVIDDVELAIGHLDDAFAEWNN
jgi:hypothetical protein